MWFGNELMNPMHEYADDLDSLSLSSHLLTPQKTYNFFPFSFFSPNDCTQRCIGSLSPCLFFFHQHREFCFVLWWDFPPPHFSIRYRYLLFNLVYVFTRGAPRKELVQQLTFQEDFHMSYCSTTFNSLIITWCNKHRIIIIWVPGFQLSRLAYQLMTKAHG